MNDWDRKIHKLDNKIQEVDAVAEKLDKQGLANFEAINDLVSRVNSQFMIAGIIGPLEDDIYPSIASCIGDLSTFKQSAEKIFGKLCD